MDAGPKGEIYRKLLEEVQNIACATLFSPVTRQEAIQATSAYKYLYSVYFINLIKITLASC